MAGCSGILCTEDTEEVTLVFSMFWVVSGSLASAAPDPLRQGTEHDLASLDVSVATRTSASLRVNGREGPVAFPVVLGQAARESCAGALLPLQPDHGSPEGSSLLSRSGFSPLAGIPGLQASEPPWHLLCPYV